jgi:LTXXQ motif family protein
MRKIGAILAITALAAVISPPQAAAFSIRLGRFYFHVPFVGHHHRHHLQMRANEARTKQSDVSRGGAAKTEQANREALVETNTPFGSCTGLAPGVTNLPIEQIRQAVQPTADQEAAFDDLNAASSQASDIIKSSCPTSVPLTPIGRLDAAAQRVNTTIEALGVIRGALARIYDSLNDEQKRRFNAMDSASQRTRSAGDMGTICPVQPQCRYRQWLGSIRSRHG